MAQHYSNNGVAWKMIIAFDVIAEILTFGLMGISNVVGAKVACGFCIWDENPHYGIHCACLKPFFIVFNTEWGQGITNRNRQNSDFTPTGKSASINQSHVYSMNCGELDEVDLTLTISQLSQDSQLLIIHQTRE
ncbi:hypothetical protein N7517_001170 [Penicillium concentricum]|uniref:Uncharacterized protein n=1 Tax=Penicillium concentricum TaxID=293559 RepID=A0A9W9VJL7_9EURO|nr:uncharacterized protein N7517_001170 [Penicillium concentricum]KAJ5383259.1 hypothetical protein N7517_001170 [Penicillium concentricum]